MTAPTELLDAEAMKKAAFAVFAKANENNLSRDKIESLWPSQHYTHWDGLAEAAVRAYLSAGPASGAAREPEQHLADDILAELVRARTKFPGKNVTFAALVEEVGELATATFEESRARVRREAVQVAVMAMRMVLDGDHTFDGWRASKGLDALTDSAPSLHSAAIAAAIAETGGRGL